MLPDTTVITWHHLSVMLPEKIYKSIGTIGNIQGEYKSKVGVFKRSLEEITKDSIDTVLELIAQKSLYKGEEWEGHLKEFLKIHKEYSKLTSDQKNNFIWDKPNKISMAITKIKNHSIGTLLMDISEGKDLDEAIKSYEKIVAPSNYKRPKAVFTQKMVEQAEAKLTELGLLDSLGRRYATIDDITINNILYANRDSAKKLKKSVFDDLKSDAKTRPKDYSKVEEIDIETFVKDVLPTATNVEVLFENDHTPNLVSLIAPINKDSKTMFKWNNNFSWAYNGNMTDSMKELVKKAGGKVDGVLRFSIRWNDLNDNKNDFDAHCIAPKGEHIYYGNKNRHKSQGNLDVDIIHPSKVAVENITWPVKNRMFEGEYNFFVRNYSHRGGRSGFSAEIEFDGQIFSYTYDKELRQSEDVYVAVVSLADGKFSVKHKIDSTSAKKETWGIVTNEFHPVSIVMYSPNYWDEQNGIGHRHYLFMLKDCINDTSPNGFFNEFLRNDLNEHRKVFEALGSKMKVEDSVTQLSGIGFSSTKKAAIACKVDGSFSRIIKVKI
jgi:hypothetical protein